MTTQVWLGDLLRAIAAGAEPRRAAEMLGLVPESAETAAAEPAAVVTGSEPAAPTPSPAPPEPVDTVDTTATALGEVPMLPELRREPAGVTDWAPGPSLPLPGADQSPEPTPLLAPRTTAAVLHALLATLTDDGEPDVEAISELWAQGKPMRILPRHPRPTLRFGVQVLVDVGEAMELFARDQHDLVTRIRAVAGVETTSVAYFADVPTRGTGPRGRRTWRDYTPPSRGTRVLLLSDFGIGGPVFHDRRGTPAEWREFITSVRRAGCSPVGLAPYPPSRRPAWLSDSMPVLLWDRGTTAGRASMAVRRG
ncbi:hypothetical protein SK803_00600 [Lentzea sp. BCCO 10_0856]|uniref:Uncharacterized protein n=1 Tax=Lentzea miocenica TaxID=3095431 RepID=A0ABU4SRZ2_9PSEU|nr:hypothetical protein [Lentzea sp. BCCO 10_0856]MDX8028682.1 hypothetical protein [Lentzea sp. BCCO 10_0856]